MRILELGCGNGTLWTERIQLAHTPNQEPFPTDIELVLSDISEGMIHDAKRNINEQRIDTADILISYEAFDCLEIPFENKSFDLVIANHVLFCCDDIAKVCQEVQRVLKPNGIFTCSTYSRNHMKEITDITHKHL